jgi:serine/threonine protein kinase
MQQIGKYQIVRELGRGATGKVYLAEDSFANRRVAIKVAFPRGAEEQRGRRLLPEHVPQRGGARGQVEPPHIVQIYDAVVEETCSYIVMEYVEGGTLEKFCKPDALLSQRDVAEIIFKCVRALAFANTLGLTHRDIKPGNILHNDGTEIKIADFGAAIDRVSDKTIIANVGSPAFMAPELVTGSAQATHVTDIYALGVVMYYMLAARLPFTGANTMSRDLPDREYRARPAQQASRGHLARARRHRDEGDRQGSGEALRDWDEFGAALAEIWKKEHARGEEGAVRHRALQHARTLPFFQQFPENELWEVLKLSKWARFKPDTVLIKEGDVGDSFFILAAATCA